MSVIIGSDLKCVCRASCTFFVGKSEAKVVSYPSPFLSGGKG